MTYGGHLCPACGCAQPAGRGITALTRDRAKTDFGFVGGPALPHFCDWGEATPLARGIFSMSEPRLFEAPFGIGRFGEATHVIRADAPSLLLQTVILRGARTSEGTLIEAVTLPWFEIIELLLKDPDAAYRIPPDKWEEIIAGVYTKAGFDEVILTPRSGDFGRDVIATKKGVCSIRVIDQVKAYKPPRLVTANDVRALMGVLQTDGASKGCLTTTSDFAPKIKTDPLIVPLIPSRLELVNGPMLFARLDELAHKRP